MIATRLKWPLRSVAEIEATCGAGGCPDFPGFVDKVRRAQEHYRDQDRQRAVRLSEKEKWRITQAFGDFEPGRVSRYNEDDFDRLCNGLGTTRTALGQLWVLQSGKSYFILAPDGNYRGPFDRQDVLPQSVLLLAPTGFDLRVFSKNEEAMKLIEPKELVERHGSVVDTVYYSLCDQQSKLGPEGRQPRHPCIPPTDAHLRIFPRC